MSLYVMSDIHGAANAFFEMLDLISFSPTDTLYILGDVIDRGEGGIKLLRFIKEQKNITLLQGNHEQLMLEAYNTGDFSLWCTYNGGEVTRRDFEVLPTEERLNMIHYLKNLPLYIELPNYLLTHAGIYTTSFLPMVWESQKSIQKEDMVWLREEFYWNKGLDDKKIIFGHTPTVCINPLSCGSILHLGDKIAIDCGVSTTTNGRLGCLELDTLKEYYTREN